MQMRRRITKAFVAAAAAGATVTTLGLAASPAGAVTAGKYFSPSGSKLLATDANCSVTPVPGDDCGMAGYVATGRDFRFASALVDVPDHVGDTEAGTPSAPADPALYVGLDNSTNATYRYARVGIAPCSDNDDFIVPGVTLTSIELPCPPDGWIIFAAVAEPNGQIDVDAEPLAPGFMGDGVALSAYATGDSVQTIITLPDGTKIQHTFFINGLAYTSAVAVADWTTAIEDGLLTAPTTPTSKVRDTQFFQGRFTTVSGSQGTFQGPWTLEALEATSNGSLPPSGTLVGQPSYLWNDGNGFNGMGSDAFGVWRFPF
jgi:hypothetical protein